MFSNIFFKILNDFFPTPSTVINVRVCGRKRILFNNIDSLKPTSLLYTARTDFVNHVPGERVKFCGGFS